MASSSSTCSVARLVLQQCLSARLQVLPPANGLPAQFVEIGKGLVVYICFMKSATLNDVGKIAQAALNTRLSEETEHGKRTSILDLPGDILIVPQATLGGRLKGKVMQYHGNVGKDLGQELYSNFVTLCKQAVESNDKSTEAGCVVLSGTYGNRQVLSLDTNGPFSHIIEFA